MEEETFLVAIYDELRRQGKDSDMYLYGATYLGTYYSEPEYDMFSMGTYPAIKTGGSNSVLLEIFEVDDKILKTADYYQGVDLNNPYNNVFDRIEIETPFGDCFLYVYSKNTMRRIRVESGDWFRHISSMKKILSNPNNDDSRWGIE